MGAPMCVAPGRLDMSFADRLHDIRQALQSKRKPLPLEDFEQLIRERTGVSISRETLRRMEMGARVPTIDEATAIASVDPLQRGRAWLAWGADAEDSA